MDNWGGGYVSICGHMVGSIVLLAIGVCEHVQHVFVFSKGC